MRAASTLALATAAAIGWLAPAAAFGPSRGLSAAEPPPAQAPADPGTDADVAWTASTVVEPESVEEVSAAVIQSRDGFVLAVGREPASGRVLGIFRLPPADQDFLDEGRGLELTIDDSPRLAARRHGGGLKSATFVLWDGVGEPVLGPLRDLMEARQRIVVAYPLAGGGHKEIALPAVGARTAIARALGVAEEVTPAARELAVERQRAVEQCLDQEKPKERDRCLETLAGCAEAATVEDLRACLAKRGKR